jgi:hypothetical protein
MGDKPGHNYSGGDDKPLPDAREFVQYLDKAGLKKDADYKYTELPGVEHNESAWQTRVEPMLLWLLGPRSA